MGKAGLGKLGLVMTGFGSLRQARHGLLRYVPAGRGTAGMEGHRVVRLDVVCYVMLGLGVSGFAWFGSVGLARCGKFGQVTA